MISRSSGVYRGVRGSRGNGGENGSVVIAIPGDGLSRRVTFRRQAGCFIPNRGQSNTAAVDCAERSFAVHYLRLIRRSYPAAAKVLTERSKAVSLALTKLTCRGASRPKAS